LSEFVVLKLVTGEQLLAEVLYEFEDSIVINFPILLKTVPLVKDGIVYERVATAEYCSFTDDKEFNIHRKDIVFVKPMSKSIELLYQRTLQEMYIIQPYDPEQQDMEETNVDLKNYH